MTVTKDTRYDIAFVDEAAGETLPLMLAGDEQGGLAFGIQMVSPTGGKLSPADVKEADLSMYTARTYMDWSGGRGQENASGPTNRFSDSYADTRVPGLVILPPQSVKSSFVITSYVAALPACTPDMAGAVHTSGDVTMVVSGGTRVNGARYAQKFTVGSYTVHVTSLALYIQRITDQYGRGVKVSIQTDSGGNPSGTVVASSIMPVAIIPDTAGWFDFIMACNLTAATAYWIVVEDESGLIDGNMEVRWHGSDADIYSGGATKFAQYTGGAWGIWGSAAADDLYFMVRGTQDVGEAPLENVVVRPVRFSNGWYVASGRRVFKWNGTSARFESVYTGAATITALAAFNGYIYAAMGDSTNMARSDDGAAWNPVSDRAYTYMTAYNGYLYAVKKSGALIYYNGTSWSSDIVTGTSDFDNTGLAGFQNELMILRTGGMASLSADIAYQVYDYSQDEAADNGKNSLAWVADGRLYVPVLQGLLAYDGFRMTPVGLDLEEGLPSGEQGRVAAMVATRSWLFAAVDAGASGRSAIYAYNGRGWHCVLKASATGQRIQSMGLERFTGSNPRLWYWENTTPYYVEMPDLTDNRYSFAYSAYWPDGIVTSSWIGGEVAQVWKQVRGIGLRTNNCTSVRTVTVYLEVDRSGLWVNCGTITISPWQELTLSAPTWTAKTVSTSGTQTLTLNAVTGMVAGHFVRVKWADGSREEWGQIASISGNQITLAQALSASPGVGAGVYPSVPVGREVRYRLALHTNSASSTPKVLGVTIRYQEQIIDRFRMTAVIRCEDGMRDRFQGAYPYSAAATRQALYRWARRLTPFTLVDPGGLNWTVKIMAGNEAAFVAQDQVRDLARMKSTVNLQLIEA